MARKRHSDEIFYGCCMRLKCLFMVVWILLVRAARQVFQTRHTMSGARSLAAWADLNSMRWSRCKKKMIGSRRLCWVRTGQADFEREPWFFEAQGLTKDQQRQAVIHTRQKLNTSERRTCKVLGVARSTWNYKPAQQDDEALRLAMIKLASAMADMVIERLLSSSHGRLANQSQKNWAFVARRRSAATPKT